MTRRRNRLLSAAAAALLVAAVAAGVIVARGTGPARPTATPPIPAAAGGGKVVSFDGEDVVTGRVVTLDDFRGKPVVINIWASWCPGCNAEARALGAFAEAHPEAAFVGVDFQDARGDARAFYARHGWRFPSVYDPDGAIAYGLGLQGTPTTIFLDSDHREVTRIVGETDAQGFADGLAAAARP